jgi:hypothetical protein
VHEICVIILLLSRSMKIKSLFCSQNSWQCPHFTNSYYSPFKLEVKSMNINLQFDLIVIYLLDFENHISEHKFTIWFDIQLLAGLNIMERIFCFQFIWLLWLLCNAFYLFYLRKKMLLGGIYKMLTNAFASYRDRSLLMFQKINFYSDRQSCSNYSVTHIFW